MYLLQKLWCLFMSGTPRRSSRAKKNIFTTCFPHKDKLRALLSLHMMLNMKHNSLCCWRGRTVTVVEIKFIIQTCFGLSMMLQSHRMMKLTVVCEEAFCFACLCCRWFTLMKHFDKIFPFSWERCPDCQSTLGSSCRKEFTALKLWQLQKLCFQLWDHRTNKILPSIFALVVSSANMLVHLK